MKIYNHIAPKLSALEEEMIKYIPPGGNWQNIPDTIPSERLAQIRRTGGRTTYYGRLQWNKPSFTITTYFHRLGNGCNLHPEQQRIISIREGARLQSFNDSYIFHGSKASQYKQIGNAVPPLLARTIARLLSDKVRNKTFIDLFAGAGGMSEGFIQEGYILSGANEIDKNYFETYIKNHEKYIDPDKLILGDITTEEVKKKIISISSNKNIGVIIGGPPCQGFSHAGWRNPDDRRNQLFKEFVLIVDKIRPEIFVLENVPGILTMRNGEAIKEIIQSFEGIGYTVSNPMKLNAEDFGVPQKRRRVVVIGTRSGECILPPTKIFSETNTSMPSPVTVFEAIGGLPCLKSNEGEFEMRVDYEPISLFEALMMEKINLETFYYESSRLIPTLFSNLG